MLEVSLWHQGIIVWQLILIEAALPVVKFTVAIMQSLPEASEAESIGYAFHF
jgi:hypothetical protein